MPATLLLADDSVTIQRVIELTFLNEDIRVIATSDGETAIQRIDAEPPDIVLADVGMPKQDGYAVSAHIKKTPILRKIPVLLLTGAFEPVDEDKARASGCDGILVKPFEPQQLVGRVKELLAGGARAAAAPERTFEIPTTPKVLVPTPPVAAPPAPARSVLTPAALAPTLLVPKIAVPQPPPPSPPPVVIPAPQAAPPLAAAKAAPKPVPAPLAAPEPPDMEASFQREFDQLDAAFAKLDPEPAAAFLDEDTSSDFARDLDLYRGSGDAEPEPAPPSPARIERPERPFGDWDLPDLPPIEPAAVAESAPVARLAPRPVSIRGVPEAPPAPVEVAPPPPVEAAPPAPPAPVEQAPAAPVADTVPPFQRVSRASAFATLLAAEQAQPGTPSGVRPAPMPDATVEEIVRRVLSRMTDDTVRRIVHDTAERLIREEIEKIKTQ